MIRLGISTSLAGTTPKEWAEQMREMGCRSVVFPVDSNAPEALIDEYVSEAKAKDLLIAEVGIWRNALAADENERKQNLEYSINQLRLADRIGAKCCVNVAGAAGPRWDGGYRENYSKEHIEKTVKMIQTIIDEAAPKNTFFTIESMPWMLPSSPDEYLKLMDMVERDRFGIHLDIINMINSMERYFFHDEFLEETFEKLGNGIVSCHMKDIGLLEEYTFRLKECACGEGSFNLEHYAELALKANPEMPMIIEHLASDDAYRESMKYVKDRLKAYVM